MLRLNYKHLWTLVVMLFLFQCSMNAKPVFELGTKLTYNFTDQKSFYTDTITGQTIQEVYAEPYYGTSVEFLMSFVNRLYFRTDLLEFRIFERGGQAIYSFPFLDSDVLYELPVGSKFSPYLFGGVGFQLFFGKQEAFDARFAFGKTYNIRAGFGMRYELNPKTKLFAECLLYTDNYTLDETLDLFIVEVERTSSVGINKINFGARFRL